MTALGKTAGGLALCLIIAFSFILSSQLAAEARIKFREIDSVSKPEYLQRKGELWKAQGRLVGTIENAPDQFTIVFTHKVKKTTHESQHNGHLTVYESIWLIPGKYDIEIKAKGFETYLMRDLEIKQGSDCLMNITFGKKVYDRAA